RILYTGFFITGYFIGDRLVFPEEKNFLDKSRITFMKFQLWQLMLIMMLAACNGNNNASTSEEDNLGIKSATEKREANLAMIAELKSTVEDGDLVLRSGTDFSSEQVKLFSRKDQTYSHGGIAFHDSGDVYIYHIVPDYLRITNKARKEKLDSFCNPSQNTALGLARYNIDSAEKMIFRDYLVMQYNRKVPFDPMFDLTNDDSMYCSEMIRNGLILATKGRVTIETHRFTDRNKLKMIKQHVKLSDKEILGREFVPIDNLYLNPNCRLLKRFIYE
ncbi:MAG: hypothetical protein WCF67_13330, partial [Chitinophagaceae bacterium]